MSHKKTQRWRTWRGKIRDHRIAQNFLHLNAKSHFKSRTTITAFFFFLHFIFFPFNLSFNPRPNSALFHPPNYECQANAPFVIVPGSREICWTLSVIDGWGTDQTWLEMTSWVAETADSSLVRPTAWALAGRGREPSVHSKAGRTQTQGLGMKKRERALPSSPPLSPF